MKFLKKTHLFFGFWKTFLKKYLIKQKRPIVFLIDEQFSKKYDFLSQIQNFLHSYPTQVIFLTLHLREKEKTRKTKAKIEDELLKNRFPREGILVAVGGGVILDIAGLIAATYLRGIDHFFLPTTLLAMVDASLGGKCAVNTPLGKNLIGAFHFPKAVGIDFSFLKTLPEAEKRQGFYEMAKHFLLKDRKLFYSLASENKKISKNLIKKSIKIKEKIVTKDPYDQKERQMLNFGHTFAHAFETSGQFQKISHGDAVSIGICAESFLSYQRGLLLQKEMELIEKIFDFVPQKPFPKEKIFQNFIFQDKKNKEGKVHIVILERIGKIWIRNGKITHPLFEKELKLLMAYLERRRFVC